MKPSILMFLLNFFNEFQIMTVWQPYIIQVLNALGTPINPYLATVLSSVFGICASIFLTLTVKMLGRRKIYLTANLIFVVC